MQLTISRKFRLFACMCRTRITVMTEMGEEVAKLNLWGGQAKTLSLPEHRYIIKASTFILFARPVENTAICYGDRFDEIHVNVEVVNFNYLANLIPGLGLSVPIFEYKLTFQYDVKKEKSHAKLCSKAIKLLGAFLGVLAIRLFIMNLSSFYSVGTDMVWALEGTDAYTAYTFEVIGELWGYWIAPVLCFILARLCFQVSRRFSRTRRDVTLSQKVMPPFILYLRSFYADAVTTRPADRVLKPQQTEEQLLVSILNDITSVIAIGRPGDSYLPRGADRLYVSDDEWQERVTELVSAAEFVVLRLGSTDGFWWETDLCLKQLSPDKLLFVIPALKDPAPLAKLENELQAHGISANLSCINTKKRSKSSISGFVTIQNNDQAKFTPLKYRRVLNFFIPAEDILRESLADFLRRHGGYVKQRSIAAWARVTWAVVCVTVLVMCANSYFKFKEFEQNRFPKELITRCESALYSQEQLQGLSDQGKMYRIFTDVFLGAKELDEQSVAEFYYLTTELLNVLSEREYQLLTEPLPDSIPEPTDLLIVARRYFNDYGYDLYLSYLEQAAAAGYDQPRNQPYYEPLAPDVQAELQHRLEQLPSYDDSSENPYAVHSYYVDIRKTILQMYEEGYPVESLLRAGLLF